MGRVGNRDEKCNFIFVFRVFFFLTDELPLKFNGMGAVERG